MKTNSTGSTLRQINTAVLGGIALGGLAALVALLRLPSETNATFLWGYSALRLALAAGLGLAVLLFTLIAVLEGTQTPFWVRLTQRAGRYFMQDGRIFWLAAPLALIFLAMLAFIAGALSPLSQTIILLSSLFKRMGLVAIWLVLTCLLLGILLRLNIRLVGPQHYFSPFRAGLTLSIMAALMIGLFKVYTLQSGDYRFYNLAEPLLVLIVCAITWGLADHWFKERPGYARVGQALTLITLWAGVFVFYLATAHLVNWTNTPSKAYWNLLADAFNHGRLYLVNPPTTHDLTLYQGNWYVPNPPFPALALMPLVALLGVEGVNMVVYSAAIAAANVSLVFWILQEASRRGMIPTGLRANLWLMALFALGTDHWWLAMVGQMWFVSQLLTLLCAAVAVLLVLKKASPWWVGLALGLAVLSRPNVFTLWPFLLGIFLYFKQQESGRVTWKSVLGWSIQSALPVVACVGVLLGYNSIRFHDFMDFGYVTINGADAIVSAVQTYGMFNLHFVPGNLELMLLRLPSLANEAGCWIVERTGYSLLAMTPALVYMFRRWRWNWWAAGAWTAVLLSAGLLAFYHNNGSAQLGFRYLMDFILPVLLLMGVGAGKRPSWVFKALVVASVIGNFAGILYWFRFGC